MQHGGESPPQELRDTMGSPVARTSSLLLGEDDESDVRCGAKGKLLAQTG